MKVGSYMYIIYFCQGMTVINNILVSLGYMMVANGTVTVMDINIRR